MPGLICVCCNKNITRTNNGSTCAECKNHFHFKCVGLSGIALANILNGKTAQWFCNGCEDKSKSRSNNSSQLSSSNRSSVGANISNVQLNKISSVVDELQIEVKKIFDNQNNVFQSFDVINGKLNEFQSVSSALKNHNIRINQLEDDRLIVHDVMKDLENRLDSIEQSKLSNSVELTGIPFADNEIVLDLILNICNKLNTVITSEDLLSYHRKKFASVSNTLGSKLPPIIVFFKCVQKRNELLASFRARRGIKLAEIGFDGDDKHFFINENLTNTRRRLFFTAKNFQKANNYKFLWTRNGNIFLKKGDGFGVINIDLHTDFAALNGD